MKTQPTMPHQVAEPAGVPEMTKCPCGGTLAGRVLTGWEAGPFGGRTVLECHDCGRREAITRRAGVAPDVARRRVAKPGSVGKICKRPECGKTFYDRRATEPREYCTVSCANRDRSPSQRGVGQTPKFYGRGGRVSGAHHVWGQRGRVELPQPTERGSNGRRLCRLCHEEVPPGRRSWCSEACVRAGWLKVSWPAMRQHIEARDRVCQLCASEHPGYHFHAGLWSWHRLPFGQQGPFRLPPSHAWEVDHINPVSNGGTDNPDNLRLLCRECHLRVTREWRRSRSKNGGTT